ncbi:hypothetical protein V865_007082 [Kwoniella europaea PYCC6329]|uniref:Uncharacterized protein n=1 Tax=Kwoniella europaea PYCC6329 TaxID=1423913 RepID=A0AAX4KRT5_9TREE
MSIHDSQPFPTLDFALSAVEAHTLEALSVTTFSFSQNLDGDEAAFACDLRESLNNRGYRVAPEPHLLKKHATKARFGVQICGNDPDAPKEALPKHWKAFTFHKLVDFIRLSEFQAAVLYWQGIENDGRLPYDQRRFVNLTVEGRGIEMTIRAFGKNCPMIRTYIKSLKDYRVESRYRDIYMLSPHISSIDRPENRILGYAIDRNKLDTDDDEEEEEEWGGISPLNVGSPASKVDEEEVYDDSRTGEEEGDVHVEEHHQERPGMVEGNDIVYIEEQVECFAEDDESEHDTDQSTYEGGSWADDEADSEEGEDDWKSEDRTSLDDGLGAGHGIEEEQEEVEKEAPVEVDREEDEEGEQYHNGEEYYIDGGEDDWYGEEQYMGDQGINYEDLLPAEEETLEWNEGIEVQHVHPGIPHVRKRSPSPADIKDKRDRSPVRKRMRIRSPSP